MSLVKFWPAATSSFYEDKYWQKNNWNIGTPITKEKLENLENGIAILATQMKAVLGELKGTIDLSDVQLNSSRLDSVQTWITGNESGAYEIAKGNIGARLNTIDSKNSEQDNRLSSIESVNAAQNSRLDSIDSLNATQNSRLDNIENLNATQNGRLDNIDNKNSEQDNRLNSIENLNANQNNRLDNIDSINNEQNSQLIVHASKLEAIENELAGTGTGTSGTSRLDNLQQWIAGTPTSQYDGAAIVTRLNAIDTLDAQQNTRLGNIESIDTTQNERLDSLEASRELDETNIATLQTNSTANRTDIDNIISEIGGTYTSEGFTNSLISKIPEIIEKNNEQDLNLGKIKLEVWGADKNFDDASRIDESFNRIDETENAVSSLSSTVSSYSSRISSAERRIRALEESGGGGGGGSSIVRMLHTINEEPSDTLILEENAIFSNNNITMIILNARTLGLENLKIQIQNDETVFNVWITDNVPLRASFSKGALLGLYLDNDTDVYVFNAPVLVAD